MRDGKLLTIVVPVYKVEPYIDKCLSSLILEDPELMDALEVIIVNDGTPDRSAEMSREYVKRYPGTFRQIDKENGGHGSAWNVGLGEATGKYLRFLDSDDWFTNLDHLMQDLRNSNADIVMNPYDVVHVPENRIERMKIPVEPGVLTPIVDSKWGSSEHGLNLRFFWYFTYKTRILKPLTPLFAEKVMYDDAILTWTPLIHGRTFVALDYVVYNYLIGRPGQSMSVFQKRKGAYSYAKCLGQYELVRSRVDEQAVPSILLKCIDSSITVYARRVFTKMPNLPLHEALEKMPPIWKHYIVDLPDKTKFERRYGALPGVVFYYVERLRRMIRPV